ncbi:MAG TPA: hypothetical protein PKD89_12365 [Candidatus Microthrix sp.]|nr:hypothetical protein [Candidatus Microthrix sp.]HMS48370.1 hypothetical protein [Candidatus Microthrix sp.]
MAQGDGAAVDVVAVVRDVERLLDVQGDGAKASFISNTSMSATDRSAMASALLTTGIGPSNISTGSAPLVAAAMMRARGVSPLARPASSLPTSTSAAPSTMPELLPAVCT